MTELLKPIGAPMEIEAQRSPDEEDFGFDVGGGGHALIDSSITEGGSGYQFGGNLYTAPNPYRLYWLGAQYSTSQNEGGDLYLDQSHYDISLVVGRGERSVLARGEAGREALTGTAAKNLFIGVGTSEGDKTLELGSDIFAYSLGIRPSGRFGFSINPHLRLFSGIPSDETTAEERSLLSLRAGVEVRFGLLDTTTTPPQEGINNYDMANRIITGGHRLGQSCGMAKALAGPSAQAQDYTEDLFGEGTTTSARLEDVGLFIGFSNWGAASQESLDTQLQLNATGAHRGWLMGSKAAFTATAFALSLNDDSTTMATQGFAGGLQLLAVGIGFGMDLDSASRRTLATAEAQDKAQEFLLIQSLIHHLAFGAAWASQEEKVGQSLLQGSHQAMMATNLLPDPAETGLAQKAISYHMIYERVKDGGAYLGGQKTIYLPKPHLYTRFRMLGQTLPAPGALREGFDDLTGRDPLTEGAKAKTQASFGGEVETGPVSWSGGLRTTLAYGAGPKPVPGVGAEEQVLLTVGNERVRFELGMGASQEYLNGKLQLGFSGVGGLRAAF